MVNMTSGHVLLSSHTSRADLLSSQDDGTTDYHHHTSVSCSEVCSNRFSNQILLDLCYCIASLITIN